MIKGHRRPRPAKATIRLNVRYRNRDRLMSGRTARVSGMAAVFGLLLLAGCQSVFSLGGEGRGASASGATSLAEIRAENGLPALAADGKLEKAAAEQAGFMASAAAMNHRTGRGKDFATRMKNNDIEGPAAENVAYGAMNTQKLFSMWMNSSGHRRNMLDPRFGRYGLASAEDGQGRRYWALVLAR